MKGEREFASIGHVDRGSNRNEENSWLYDGINESGYGADQQGQSATEVVHHLGLVRPDAAGGELGEGTGEGGAIAWHSRRGCGRGISFLLVHDQQRLLPRGESGVVGR